MILIRDQTKSNNKIKLKELKRGNSEIEKKI